MKLKIKSWFDRRYNRLFHKSECIKMKFVASHFDYNYVIYNGNGHYRCLGKDWYREFKIDERL